jgi:hypothetical protein
MIVTRTFERASGTITLHYSFPKSGRNAVVHIGENNKALMKESAIGRNAMSKILDDLESRGVISMARRNSSPFPDQHSISAWKRHFLG